MDPLKITIIHHEEYEIEIQRDERGKLIEPKCPSCSVGVNRPKCAFELGDSCPRHDLKDAFMKAMKDPKTHNFHKNGYHPEICYYCRKAESEHD